MKSINTYISEALKIKSGAKLSTKYKYHPENREELDAAIDELIKLRGNEAILNDIDTSKITDMSGLFASRKDLVSPLRKLTFSTDYDFSKFKGDISEWDTSNVTTMRQMFYDSLFNDRIDKWDVRNVTDMTAMFRFSNFCQDISNWKLHPDCEIGNMYKDSFLELKKYKSYQAIK